MRDNWNPDNFRDDKGNLVHPDFNSYDISAMGWSPTLTWGMRKYTGQLEDFYLVGIAWIRESNGEYFYYRLQAPSLEVGIQKLTWLLLDFHGERARAEKEYDDMYEGHPSA